MLYYNVWLDVAAVIMTLFSLLYALVNRNYKFHSSKIFICINFVLIISEILDIITAEAINGAWQCGNQLFTILNTIQIITFNSVTPMFLIYLVFSLHLQHFFTRRMCAFFVAPFMVDLILILGNTHNHFLFEMTENGYVHGSLFSILYFIAFIYLIECAYYIIKYWKSLRRSVGFTMICVIIMSLFPIGIQYFHSDLLIIAFMLSLCSLAIELTVEGDSDIKTFSTKVYRRDNFINRIETVITNESKIEVVCVKIPDSNYYGTALGIKKLEVLMYEIASWLESSFVGKASVFDCQGGHFTMIFYPPHLGETEDAVSRIYERFKDSWTIFDGNESFTIKVPVQVSGTGVPNGISTTEELMILIDNKFSPVNGRSEIISDEDFRNYKKSISIEAAIKRAIKNDSFEVYYQPIWNTFEKRVDHCEALVRLNDPELGFLTPGEFIPLSEQTGLIIDVGRIVFTKVCKFISSGEPNKAGIDYINVNLSTIQLMDEKFADDFMEIAKKFNVPTGRINLEVTESALVNNTDMMERLLRKLKGYGFSLSMDDYGTGYSNFTYIFDMPFDSIKLDKSLLWAIDNQEKAYPMLKYTIKMMKQMNFTMVVEGVETEAQKKLLEELEADSMQGYLFSAPVPENDFIRKVIDVNNKMGG